MISEEREILEIMLHDIIKDQFLDRRHNSNYLLTGIDAESTGFHAESKEDIADKRMKYIKQTSDSDLVKYLKNEFYPVLSRSRQFDRIDKIVNENRWDEPGY